MSVPSIQNGQSHYDIAFRLFSCWLAEIFVFTIFTLCFHLKAHDYDSSHIIDFMATRTVSQKHHLKLRKCEVTCYMDSCNDK